METYPSICDRYDRPSFASLSNEIPVIEFSSPPPQPKPLKTPNAAPTPQQQRSSVKASFMQRFTRQQDDEVNSGDDTSFDEVVSDEVVETSYHLKTGTIDILLCDDDCNSTGNGSLHPCLRFTGSLQYRFEAVQVDLYPHRTANASRRHWSLPVQYVKDGQQWATEMLGDFIETSPTVGE
eukprot:sb/3471715/